MSSPARHSSYRFQLVVRCATASTSVCPVNVSSWPVPMPPVPQRGAACPKPRRFHAYDEPTAGGQVVADVARRGGRAFVTGHRGERPGRVRDGRRARPGSAPSGCASWCPAACRRSAGPPCWPWHRTARPQHPAAGARHRHRPGMTVARSGRRPDPRRVPVRPDLAAGRGRMVPGFGDLRPCRGPAGPATVTWGVISAQTSRKQGGGHGSQARAGDRG
jgi:hypothetical protein